MLSRAKYLALSSHPGPTLAVTVLAALLATALGYPVARILVIAAAVVLGQLSIGFSNDWIDAKRDTAVGRTDKPVAQGLVPVGVVRRAALSTFVVSVAVSIALGPAAAVAHVVLVLSGWAYNAGLKRTPLSVLPFVMSFGLLPAVVTLAGQQGSAPALWAVVTGAVFGISIHFTNVLPDLADDAETDVRGLPHRLGARVSGLVAFGALVVASFVVLLGPVVEHPGIGLTPVSLAGFLVGLALAAVGVRRVLVAPPDRFLFQLVIAASLVIAVQLILSGTRLVG